MARNPLSPLRGGGGGLFGGAEPFMSLQREVNRLFDDLFRGPGLPPPGEAPAGTLLSATMNVSETDKEIRITAELPGVAENDLDVRLEDDVLTIRGEKRFEHEEGGEKESYHLVERSYGTFQRALRIPYSVDPDQVRAAFRDGVLTVTMPKTREPERSRRIQVGRGEAAGEAGRIGQGGAGMAKTGEAGPARESPGPQTRTAGGPGQREAGAGGQPGSATGKDQETRTTGP